MAKKKQTSKKFIWSMLGVLAFILVIGGGYYVFSNSGEQSMYVKDKTLCEPDAAYYADSRFLADDGEKALVHYIQALMHQVDTSKGRWYVTDFGNMEDEVSFLGLRPVSEAQRKAGIGESIFLFAQVKVFELIGDEYTETNIGCDALVAEEIQRGSLKLIDKRANVYYYKEARGYIVCSANDKFLWLFANRVDAVEFGRADKVCADKFAIPKALPLPLPIEVGQPVPVSEQ